MVNLKNNVHLRLKIKFYGKIIQMNIYDIASIPRDFKSWSLAHKQHANDDKPPGGATPIALPMPDAPLRTLARGTVQNR